MNLEQLTAYAKEMAARPKVPLIITAEWVEANKQEAVRMGIIDQNGRPTNKPFIKD